MEIHNRLTNTNIIFRYVSNLYCLDNGKKTFSLQANWSATQLTFWYQIMDNFGIGLQWRFWQIFIPESFDFNMDVLMEPCSCQWASEYTLFKVRRSQIWHYLTLVSCNISKHCCNNIMMVKKIFNERVNMADLN